MNLVKLAKHELSSFTRRVIVYLFPILMGCLRSISKFSMRYKLKRIERLSFTLRIQLISALFPFQSSTPW